MKTPQLDVVINTMVKKNTLFLTRLTKIGI